MIAVYENKYEDMWDRLILNNSSNGNFLQTRRFLNYHRLNEFADHSLLFFKGETLAAVLPANETERGRVLISHQGSTFGGLIIDCVFCSTTNYNWMFKELMEHIRERRYEKVELRMPHWLYRRCDSNNELLDYYFQLNQFEVRSEVGFFIDLRDIDSEYELRFDTLKRRKLKKAYKQRLSFCKLETIEQIEEFYGVLEDNMHKFGTTPLHSCEELIDFRFSRLREETSFYGVYHEEKLIAGSMVFNFCNKKVFHTQYLASRRDCLSLCPNEYLYTKLIASAKEEGYRFLSFGTATLQDGEVYNENLGVYKEGYHTDTYVNRTYIWKSKLFGKKGGRNDNE